MYGRASLVYAALGVRYTQLGLVHTRQQLLRINCGAACATA